MADYGLKIFGVNGNVQIDQDFITMAFLSKGSITLDQKQVIGGPAPSFSNSWVSSSAQAAAGGILCAFRARYESRPVGVLSAASGGSSTQFIGLSNDTVAPIVDYWIFGRPPAETSQFGAQVLDAAGNRVWTTSGRPMRVVDAKNDEPRSNHVLTGPSSNYAVCAGYPLGGVRSGTETFSGGIYYWNEARLMWGAGTSTGFAAPSAQVCKRLNNPSYPTGWRDSDIRATMLLIDVTGL